MIPIDHDERRNRIAEVAVDIIAREGLPAATIRRIAAEVGFSTTVVTHYFSDKQELLLWTYRALARQGMEQFENVISRDPTDLVGALLTMTAADEQSIRRWRVYVAFWDRAARDPVFAAEQRLRVEEALASLEKVVHARNGESEDMGKVCRLLNAMVQGISLQALVDRQSWPIERVRNVLAGEIEAMLGAPAGQSGEEASIS